jgi:hypothetical protein
MGFMNYIYSIPLLFFALGAYKKGSCLFYLFTSMLFITHPAVYGLFVFVLLTFYLSSRKETSKILFSLSLLFLFFILLLISASTNSSHGVNSNPNTLLNQNLPNFLLYGFIENLINTIFFGFQFFQPDYIGILGFVIISILYAKQLFLDLKYDRRILFVSFVLLLFIVFCPPVIPAGKGIWNPYNVRFFSVVALLLITDLWITDKLGKSALLIFLVLLSVNSYTMFLHYSEADKHLINLYEPVIEKLPPGKKIYQVDLTSYKPGFLYTSNHTYGLTPFLNFFAGYYSIKGGFSSAYFGSGVFSATWPLNYTVSVYYPFCRSNTNISYSCHLCDHKGEECFYTDYKNYSTAEDERFFCVNCARPMAVVCQPLLIEDTYDFIDDGYCIPCVQSNISCILRSKIITEEFDYLLVFSTSDDISDYLITGLEPYLTNQDIIVYKTKENA